MPEEDPPGFKISEKLYGRQNEFASLLKVFNRVCEGKREFFLVSGDSGAGKSSLVNELNHPSVRNNSFFISGKFNCTNESIPYSGFIEAFDELVRQISRDESDLLLWKSEIEECLEDNINVMTHFIPSLVKVTGEQPALVELGVPETVTRFKYFLHRFLQIFASVDHPLILFLDDLQWADRSSLDLIEFLLEGDAIPYLFVVGTHCNADQHEIRPLQETLEGLRKNEIYIHTVNVPALQEEDVHQLLIDTFAQDSERVSLLSKLCYDTTNGNPFFLKQFLISIYKEELIKFAVKLDKWIWKVETIMKKGIGPNVLELMQKRIQQLPLNTQRILMLASMLGNRFGLETLSRINKKSLDETEAEISGAVLDGLIISEDSSYRFLHDKVQEAAHSLIPEDQRAFMHYRIAQALLSDRAEDKIQEDIFEIIKHVNFYPEIHQNDKIPLIKLNLTAGKKAQSGAAIKVASEYFERGKNLISEYVLKAQTAPAFDLLKEHITCYCFLGNVKEAEASIQVLLNYFKDAFHRAEIAKLQVLLYTTADKDFEKALQCGVNGLIELGLDIPRKPNKYHFIKERLLTKWNLGKRTVATLLDAPEMTDPIIKLQVDLLVDLIPLALFKPKALLAGILILKVANLGLKHGNSSTIAGGYIFYAILFNIVLHDFKQASEFGQLAIALNEKYPELRLKSRIYTLYGIHIYPFNFHYRTIKDFLKKAIKIGLDTGDSFYTSVACLHVMLWDPNLSLDITYKESTKYLHLIHPSLIDILGATRFSLQFKANLLEKTTGNIFSFNDTLFNEDDFVLKIKETPLFNAVAVSLYFKFILHFLYFDYMKSFEYLREIERIPLLFQGPASPEFCLYSFLVYSVLYKQMSKTERKEAQKRLKKEYQRMKRWAAYCPVNFSHLQLLMEAELARIYGKSEQAIYLYERAIDRAKINDFIAMEALANELAGKFYLEENLPKLAQICFIEAHNCYAKWGADSKLTHLQTTYPQFFSQSLSTTQTQVEKTISTFSTTAGTTAGVVEAITVIEASQTISGEIILENLIRKTMEIVIGKVGAKKAALILKEDGHFFVEAEKTPIIDIIEVLQHQLPTNLPLSIINQVITTKETLVLDDASQETAYLEDPYIKNAKPKSILCHPLLNQGVLIGILYFENNMNIGNFTSERCALLNLLSPQIAISIENSRFYSLLENIIKVRSIELSQKNSQLQDTLAELGGKQNELSHVIEELTATKVQLIESEKLAGLKQLAMDIARKMSTPLGAVKASAQNSMESFVASLNNIPVLFSLMSHQKLKIIMDVLNISESSLTVDHTPKEQRQMKKHLIEMLDAKGMEDSNKIADILIEIGHEDEVINLIEPLGTEAFPTLNFAYNLHSIVKNNKNILTAIEENNEYCQVALGNLTDEVNSLLSSYVEGS